MGFFKFLKKQNKEEKVTEDKKSFVSRLSKGLSKTSGKLVGGLENIVLGQREIDEELLEEIEELFITSDVGVQTSVSLIDEIKEEVSRRDLKNGEQLKNSLKAKIKERLDLENAMTDTADRPVVVLIVGVNGAGKTTSIAKLANLFKKQGLKPILAAGDTFRAAAVEQLSIWADRVNVPIIKQAEGSDPAAVIFDAVQSAKSKNADILIADTAGRLHTKFNLMKELEKIKRVIKKEMPDAPHEILLVIDATSGQNALSQAKKFHEEFGLTGIILTKLDGTAKGGAIIGIVDELQVPVKFIGFGEGLEDLRPFDADSFTEALFAGENAE